MSSFPGALLCNALISVGIQACYPAYLVSPVVMYGYKSQTITKAERQRIDALNCGVGEDS